ncbi:MAG: hypothetical protein HY364_03885 [Candidatus Aenigmarchaeota archaeon]|nr:hypothetical protein [Candidatus Aenigmarchaeota archaeon]
MYIIGGNVNASEPFQAALERCADGSLSGILETLSGRYPAQVVSGRHGEMMTAGPLTFRLETLWMTTQKLTQVLGRCFYNGRVVGDINAYIEERPAGTRLHSLYMD